VTTANIEGTVTGIFTPFGMPSLIGSAHDFINNRLGGINPTAYAQVAQGF
jgi:hypothetical protein